MKRLYPSFSMLVFAAVSFGAVAADYPDKPIRMVVPWSPGGGSDVSGRIIAAKLIKRVILHAKKTAFIVEHDFIMATRDLKAIQRRGRWVTRRCPASPAPCPLRRG